VGDRSVGRLRKADTDRYSRLSQLLSPESLLSKAAKSRCGLESSMTAYLIS
jgi:hypothetical protein